VLALHDFPRVGRRVPLWAPYHDLPLRSVPHDELESRRARRDAAVEPLVPAQLASRKGTRHDAPKLVFLLHAAV
jgi:hypothetical protein